MTSIYPGSTLGMLGGGQLGRMFCSAAREMGYKIHIFAPEKIAPAADLADKHFMADYSDFSALEEFTRSVSVVTLEFENVPTSALQKIQEFAPVRPDPKILYLSQNRLREKSGLEKLGFDVTPYAKADSLEVALSAFDDFQSSCILKTTEQGYDGKGQATINSRNDLMIAWKNLGNMEKILEKRIDLKLEISVVVARSFYNDNFQISTLGPIENLHKNGILHLSSYPANVGDLIEKKAIEIATEVATKTDYLGVLCVEFFLTNDDKLLINEIAPRPHNSGHLTIDSFSFSQFHQQVRAVCNLPLGRSGSLTPAAMVNLLGECWKNNSLNYSFLENFPSARLHLYGKNEALPGRKMGHITVCNSSVEEAKKDALLAYENCIALQN